MYARNSHSCADLLCLLGTFQVELEPPGADWSARFDGRYSCKCTQGFTGDNCDVADADAVKLVLAVALGAVAVVGLGIGLARVSKRLTQQQVPFTQVSPSP